jgi:hypothetical protein
MVHSPFDTRQYRGLRVCAWSQGCIRYKYAGAAADNHGLAGAVIGCAVPDWSSTSQMDVPLSNRRANASVELSGDHTSGPRTVPSRIGPQPREYVVR